MSSSNGLLSICCLGYNHGKFIEKNIRSIWDIDYENIEIIVLDDGSSDNSKEILKSLKAQSKIPMTLIFQKNSGNVAKNFNETIKRANGEYITFISLDDFFKAESIKKAIDIMQKEHLAFVAASKIIGVDFAGNVINTVPPLRSDTIDNPTIDDLLNLEYEDFGAFYIQGSFFRKEIVDSVDGYDEDMTGDDIILRTKIFNFIKKNPNLKFKILHEPLCFYRQHDSNIHLNGLRQIKIITEYLERYWSNKVNPKLLIDSMKEVIGPMHFRQALASFSLNARTASLLKEQELQSILIKKSVKENSLLRYIYYKEKKGNLRIVKIFSIFKFKYTRKIR